MRREMRELRQISSGRPPHAGVSGAGNLMSGSSSGLHSVLGSRRSPKMPETSPRRFVGHHVGPSQVQLGPDYARKEAELSKLRLHVEALGAQRAAHVRTLIGPGSKSPGHNPRRGRRRQRNAKLARQTGWNEQKK